MNCDKTSGCKNDQKFWLLNFLLLLVLFIYDTGFESGEESSGERSSRNAGDTKAAFQGLRSSTRSRVESDKRPDVHLSFHQLLQRVSAEKI